MWRCMWSARWWMAGAAMCGQRAVPAGGRGGRLRGGLVTARWHRHHLRSIPRAVSTHQEDDHDEQQEEADPATAVDRTAEVEAPAAEDEQEDEDEEYGVHGRMLGYHPREYYRVLTPWSGAVVLRPCAVLLTWCMQAAMAAPHGVITPWSPLRRAPMLGLIAAGDPGARRSLTTIPARRPGQQHHPRAHHHPHHDLSAGQES